jgi:hypothetical protein
MQGGFSITSEMERGVRHPERDETEGSVLRTRRKGVQRDERGFSIRGGGGGQHHERDERGMEGTHGGRWSGHVRGEQEMDPHPQRKWMERMD